MFMRVGFVLLFALSFAPGVALAQRVDAVFDQNCASCHEVGAQAVNGAKNPDRKALRRLTPEAVYDSITNGSMKDRAQNLTDSQRQAIAEYIGGRKLGTVDAGDAKRMSDRCAANPPMGDIAAGPSWNGWSADGANTRFQPSKGAGILADDVRRLKLKWSFGVPGATSVYGQPSVVAGRVFVAADTGYVYSLDAKTGCVYWSFLAEGGVRNAVSVGPLSASQGVGGEFAAFFADLKGNAYAVNARTGELIWTVEVDDHPLARLTGAPKLYENRLYVPVASGEEATAAQPNYPCCTFRGSLVALDTATGKQIWKTYVIPETPKVVRKSSKGVDLWGPAGGGVWNSPTIDPKRHALYIGTGDAYTDPAGRNTDGLMALDLATGKPLWSVQDLAKDAWLVGCPADVTKRPENCPKELGPDYDFGASPILKNLPGGKSILVAGQKSGMVWGHDPDKRGAVVWKAPTASTAPGPGGQIVWGGTADDQSAYFGLYTGGIVALQLTNGERRWFTPLEPAPALSNYRGQEAAVSSIPGAVFSGGLDGVLRALSTSGGRVMWEFNMVQEYYTVNGVAAKGGSMGAAGPTVAGGMLFAGAGYTGPANGMPGNVLLAFGVE
jgi:polyvinyl alcohol dehydrogenase (cytochrome)